MFSKFKKIYLILGVILFSISLTSCFRANVMIFTEGLYEYTGEPFVFFEDVVINKISFNFTLTDKNANETNVITNRANKKNYYVDFGMESDGKFEYYDFTYLSNRVNQAERYFIKFDVSNLIAIKDSYAIFLLDFHDIHNSSNMSLNINVSLSDLSLGDDYKFPSGFQLPEDLKMSLVAE